MARWNVYHFLFEPIEFLEKLAAIIPRPAVNLLLYHGILALHARWRSPVVRYGRPSPESTARQFDASPRAAGTPGAWTWAALMRRVFEIEVLACPRCGGRLRVLATVQDPRAVTTTPRRRRAAGDRDADPHLRPLEATVAGPPPGSRGEPGPGRTPAAPAEVALVVPMHSLRHLRENLPPPDHRSASP